MVELLGLRILHMYMSAGSANVIVCTSSSFLLSRVGGVQALSLICFCASASHTSNSATNCVSTVFVYRFGSCGFLASAYAGVGYEASKY